MLKTIILVSLFFTYSFSEIFFIAAPDANRISKANKSNRVNQYLISHMVMNNLDTIIRRTVYNKKFYVKIEPNNYSYKYIRNNYKKVSKFLKSKGYRFIKKKLNNQLIYIISWK